MNILTTIACKLAQGLNGLGQILSQLGLRLLLAWEFGESGVEKLSGKNWFQDIQAQFPPPFNAISPDLNWSLAIGTELLGALALALGLGTRFAAFALIGLDIVAWIAVHAGNGYNVCENGFKLPLIYLIMLIPLLLSGPGKASLDHLIVKRLVG
ncbi:MAG: HvfX family Cu-binding RiPP maturation protein [Gammaproteobacteria bacterium]